MFKNGVSILYYAFMYSPSLPLLLRTATLIIITHKNTVVSTQPKNAIRTTAIENTHPTTIFYGDTENVIHVLLFFYYT